MAPETAVAFLSSAWFDALAAALAGAPASDGAPFALGQLVTDVPDGAGVEGEDASAGGEGGAAAGEVAYTIRLGGGRAASLERGSVARADAVVVTEYADARALAAGEASASSLIASGRIKIRGDAARLVEVAEALQQAAEAIGGLHLIVT